MPRSRTRSATSTQHLNIGRSLQERVRRYLCVVAAGRCQLCNKFLFEHPTTLLSGNFWEAAHIIAFQPDGQRGSSPNRPRDINSIENLMLLCFDCHQVIDVTDPTGHPEQELIRLKREHEARVREATDVANPPRTAIVRFVAPTRGRNPNISFEDARDAAIPRFPISRPGTLIDLRSIAGAGDDFVRSAVSTIRRDVASIYAAEGEARRAGHVSVFGIAPIPLLAYLGHCLSDMFPVALFPHDPDSNRWVWHDEGRPPIGYETVPVRGGSDPAKVALVLSLSGSITMSSLPAVVDSGWTIYETKMVGREPAPGFLRQPGDLDAFRAEYRSALARIKANHPNAPEVHLFAAVPPPIAIVCGLDRRREVQAPLVVYQNTETGFIPMITINDYES